LKEEHKFAAACSAAWKAIRLAKEEWFVHKAKEAERGTKKLSSVEMYKRYPEGK